MVLEERIDSTYPCLECDIALDTRDTLVRHMKRTHRKEYATRFKCDKCEITVFTEFDIMTHLKNEHQENSQPKIDQLVRGDKRMLRCTECRELFSRKTELINHNRILHIQGQYKAANRPTTGNPDSRRLKAKSSTVGKTKARIIPPKPDEKKDERECKFCALILPSAEQTLDHMKRRHLDDIPSLKRKSLKCDSCFVNFDLESDLSSHILSEHLTSRQTVFDSKRKKTS